jgi:DNA polymerase III alpha subunit
MLSVILNLPANSQTGIQAQQAFGYCRQYPVYGEGAAQSGYTRYQLDRVLSDIPVMDFSSRTEFLKMLDSDGVVSARRVKAKRIADYLDRYVCLIGWSVTQKEVWTKDGLTMSFLTLEDETAIYETVIFPKVYDKYGKLLFDQIPLLVYGWVKDDHGAITLEVNKVTPL